ncbi:hypothetical protein M3Y99_01943300 [Aphelenchoides fujianensis]|nr:hypothetical protein M3Y99_01943300 [Aphelenchoides fujianensis]
MSWPRPRGNRFAQHRLLACVYIALLLIVYGLVHNYVLQQSTAPSHCYCKGENFCFPGLDEAGRRVYGKRFDCSHYEFLKSRQLFEPHASYTPTAVEEMDASWTPLFVTAVSSNHFNESRVMIKRLRSNYPHSTIIYYDLGLTPEQARTFRAWCNVVYRTVDFFDYPPHVADLQAHSFKLLLLDVLQEHKAFVFLDSSARLLVPRLNELIARVQSGEMPPMFGFRRANHSIYATTNPAMYKYLPISASILQRYNEPATTMMFISDSEYTRRVLKWYTLCMLTEDCIQTASANKFCRVKQFASHDVYNKYLNCHRYDQVQTAK